MGGQSKFQKKIKDSKCSSSKDSTMYRVHDRLVAKFWLSKEIVDLNQNSLWADIRAELSKMNVKKNVAYLKSRWIEKIDPILEDMFEIELPHRSTFGFKDELSSEEKLTFLSNRLKQAQKILKESVEGDNDLMIIETQSNHGICTLDNVPISTMTESSNTGALNKSASQVSNSPMKNASPRTQIVLTEHIQVSKCQQKDEKTKLEPTAYPKLPEMACSGMTSGSNGPLQLFQNKTFFLLELKNQVVGSAIACAQEHLIKLHGGTVIERMDYVAEDTIYIASHIPERNRQFYGSTMYNIHCPSLIYSHVDEQMYLTTFSANDHIYL